MPPTAPCFFQAAAIWVSRVLAVSAAAGGRHRPARVAVPFRLGPVLDPGVLLGLLAPPPGRVRVGVQHRALQRGAQLPGGHARRPGAGSAPPPRRPARATAGPACR